MIDNKVRVTDENKRARGASQLMITWPREKTVSCEQRLSGLWAILSSTPRSTSNCSFLMGEFKEEEREDSRVS